MVHENDGAFPIKIALFTIHLKISSPLTPVHREGSCQPEPEGMTKQNQEEGSYLYPHPNGDHVFASQLVGKHTRCQLSHSPDTRVDGHQPPNMCRIQSKTLPTLVGVLTIARPAPSISSRVVLVVRTVGNYTAFRLLDTSQVPVGVGVDSQSHSLEKDDIVAGEVRVVSFVCSSVNTSRAKQRLR